MDSRKLIFWCVLVFTLGIELYGRTLPQHLFITENLITTYSRFFWGIAIALFFVAYKQWKALDALLAVAAAATVLEVVFTFRGQPFFFDGLHKAALAVLGAALAWALVLLTNGETRESYAHTFLLIYTLSLLPMVALGALVSAVRDSSADVFALAWTLGCIGLVAWFVRR